MCAGAVALPPRAPAAPLAHALHGAAVRRARADDGYSDDDVSTGAGEDVGLPWDSDMGIAALGQSDMNTDGGSVPHPAAASGTGSSAAVDVGASGGGPAAAPATGAGAPVAPPYVCLPWLRRRRLLRSPLLLLGSLAFPGLPCWPGARLSASGQ